ncbi:repressor LexA [Candidatus Gottesmanbacteria bacterium RIFCSPHIGHO2_01_FULL_46_14]|uniref:LexA repressor n=3 Tax=Candidatus Gottesmaniibacteriota TaxID=1752720 RepID=A0A1F5ZPW1_9BACT|nr:MAG: LexA repressor [Candidatus Gottesmanbacteria bacterium GW2011_GWA1_47_8]OGG14536.1 MAG: repressor LexA [Candidatus Gottesmanbacteria bacterium RIFCSPHIGHO2_01_FULL_46_14]OGG29232.1 MAG: repressor LexA [Candidatus Gottesmanbacteria bacterium RIFCSPLOWO2_01_FULL_46_21]
MALVLYPRERQILDFIIQFSQRHGFAPTLKEIGDAMGTNSPATVHEHIDKLRQKGFIKKLDGTARGLEVVVENYRTGENQSAVEVPVLGFIAAGAPLEPLTDPNFYISVAPSMIAASKASYVLQVKGTSMIDDGILDGDYVVIQHQQDAKNGDIVVALLPNGLATLKRIYFEKERIKLMPANSQMAPIFATHVKIQGRVVGLIRKYSA